MKLLSLDDLERESMISKETWRVWIRQGKLKRIKIGRHVRVEETEFERFLNLHRRPVEPKVEAITT